MLNSLVGVKLLHVQFIYDLPVCISYKVASIGQIWSLLGESDLGMR